MAQVSSRPMPPSVFSPSVWLSAVIGGMLLYLSAGFLLHSAELDSSMHAPSADLLSSGIVRGRLAWNAVLTQPSPPGGIAQAMYRPISTAAFRLQTGLWQSSASSYLSVNLLLFVGCLSLMVGVVCRLTDNAMARTVAVLTFAVHPMASEAVHTPAGQAVLLALAGLLGALWLTLLTRDGLLRSTFGIPCMTLAMAVAVGSHELGLLAILWLPAALWLAPSLADVPDYIAGEVRVTGERGISRRARRKAAREAKSSVEAAADNDLARRGSEGPWQATPVLVAAVVVVAVYLALRWRALDNSLWPAAEITDQVFRDSDFSRLTFIPAGFLTALVRLAWPIHPTLVYTLNPPDGGLWSSWGGVLALILGFAILWIAVWRRERMLSLGLVIVLSVALAISHLIPLGVLFSETPLIVGAPGVGLILGGLIGLLSPTGVIGGRRLRGRAALTGVACGLLALAWQTYARGTHWRGGQTLWRAEAALHPENPEPRLGLLRAAIRGGDRGSAIEAADQARAVARPQDLDALALLESRIYAADDPEKFRELLRARLDDQAVHKPGSLSELAAQALRYNEGELARQLWERELELYPNAFEPLHHLALLAQGRGEHQLGLDYIRRALEHADAGERAVALALYGTLLADSNQIDAAVSHLEQAIQLDPTLYNAYVYLARIMWGRGQYPQAEQVLRLAVLNTKVESYSDLAEIELRMLQAQGRQTEALRRSLQMVSTYPGDSRLAVFVAYFQLEYDEFDAARRIFERLQGVTAGEVAADVWVGLGLVRARQEGNMEAARAAWLQALRIQPGHAEATRMLSNLERSRRRRDASEEQLDATRERLAPPESPGPQSPGGTPLGGAALGGAALGGEAPTGEPLAESTPDVGPMLPILDESQP